MSDDTKDFIDKNLENFHYATWLIKAIAVLIGFVTFIFSRNAFIFFIASMIPSITVLFIDRAQHKCLSATIFTFNLIGVSKYLKILFNSNSIDSAARNLISDFTSWFVIYVTSLIGLAVYFVLPALIAQFYIWKANMKIKTLQRQRDKVASEWQITVRNNIE